MIDNDRLDQCPRTVSWIYCRSFQFNINLPEHTHLHDLWFFYDGEILQFYILTMIYSNWSNYIYIFSRNIEEISVSKVTIIETYWIWTQKKNTGLCYDLGTFRTRDRYNPRSPPRGRPPPSGRVLSEDVVIVATRMTPQDLRRKLLKKRILSTTSSQGFEPRTTRI